MSSSTAIPISPELVSSFKNGNSRYYIVHIKNELLVLHYAHPKGSSLQSDWNTISNKATEAGYILIEIEPKKYLTITFVPKGTKIRDKMIYAATKATLLNHLGYQFFVDELHANDSDELEYKYFVESSKPVSSLSAHEIERNAVHKAEDEERNFRASMAPISSGNRVMGSAGRPMGGRSSGIGGYHSVAMPFDQSAKDLVKSLNSGTYNFVELAVNDKQNGITGVKGSTVGSSYQNEVNTSQPRYYLVKQQGRNAFVYCCPPKSPQKLRMVYSTAKGSVISEAKGLGFNVPKAGEITETSEFTSSFVSGLGASSPSVNTRNFGGPTRASGSNVSKSARESVISGAHPVYSLMGGGSGRSKKIVLPPPGAY